jgi:PAS domain S-box-containing protein
MKNQRESSLLIRLAAMAILGLFIALAASAYLSGRQVDRDSQLLDKDAVPGTIDAHNMRMAMSRGIGWAMVAASAQTTQSRDASLKIVNDADVAFADYVKRYEATIRIDPVKDRALLERVKSSYAEYYRQRMAYEALILTGDRDGSAAFLEHHLVPAYLPASEAAEELLDYNHAHSVAYANHIHGSVHRLYWAVAVVVVLALVCAVVLIVNLSIRRREVMELRASEARFRMLIESAPTAISISRGNSTIYVNRKYLDLYGFKSVDEVADCPVTDQWAPEFREMLANRIQQRARGEPVPNEYEGIGQRRDGSLFPVHVAVTSVELSDGKASLAFLTDMAERKRLEQKQVELAAIVESSEDAIIGKSLTGIITSWNRGAEKIFGYTAAEVIGQPLLILFPPERQHEEAGILARIARGETVQHFETVRVRKDGREIFISATISPLKDGNGKVIGASKIARDITAEKQAQESLREKQAQLVLAMDIAKLAHWEFDVVNNLFSGDEHIFELLGTTPEQEGGFSMPPEEYIRRFVHPEDAGLVASETALATAATDPGYARQFEQRIIRRDGAERVFLTISRILMDASGRPGKILGTDQDITERKQAEVRIRQLNRIYAVLSAINKTIVREKEPQAMLTEACRIAVEKGEFRMAWIGMFDAATQKVLPVTSAGVTEGYLDSVNIDLNDTARSKGPSARCFLSGEHVISGAIEHDPLMLPWREEALKRDYRSSACFPLKVAGKTRGIFCLYSSKAGFFNEEELLLLDELAMDIGFALEVSEGEAKRRQAEQELRWRTAFFEAQVHSAIDGILVVDSEGRKLLQNRRMNELWEIPPHIADDPDDSKQIQFVMGRVKEPEAFAEKIAHLNARPDETSSDVIALLDGTIMERYSAPVRGSDGRYYGRVWTFHDITERKKLEQQFLRAQRMESIGTLASGVAHDLNNILSPIMMSVAVLRMGITDEEREGIIDTIEMSADRGAQIVKQVLTFGRGLDGEKHPLQIEMLIKDIVKIMRGTFPKDIAIETEAGTELWLVLGDATQLHQVLLNLCVNARDAMPGGGRLRLSAANLDIDASYASMLPESVPGPYVLLEVADTGGGIPPEIQELIFDPFFTTKGIGKGTGLGLSTVHGIVKNHGGFIKVASEPGKGTVFRIYLPAAPDQDAETADASSAALPRGNGELVLVVDDETAITTSAKNVLGSLGYRVLLANDGTEAMALFAQKLNSIALVITDIMMPHMGGVAMARALRKMKPGIPVIASTGLGEKAHISELKEMGIETILSKPYNAETLLRTIHGVLHPPAVD